jgi:hypothetical protein
MGVVIEICIKYPGGPTRNTGADVTCYIISQVSPNRPLVLIARPSKLSSRSTPHLKPALAPAPQWLFKFKAVKVF